MPFLAVDNAAEAIEFYTRALGARERMRMPGPAGKIAHCELEIGSSLVIVADLLPGATSKPTEEVPGTTLKPPKMLGGTSVGVFFFVETSTASASEPSTPGRPLHYRLTTGSGAIASASSSIRSGTNGAYRRIGRT
jgi:PhnB protein